MRSGVARNRALLSVLSEGEAAQLSSMLDRIRQHLAAVLNNEQRNSVD